MKMRENELHEPNVITKRTPRNTWHVILECVDCGIYVSDYEHTDKATAQNQAHFLMRDHCPNCGARLKEIEK